MTDLLFYDGTCGLCHRTVSVVLARDREGTRFRYAPLAGATFAETFPPAERARLPDSLVLRTADGRVLTRADAALRIAERLGGGWATVAAVLGLFPRWLLDLGYDGIARVRRRVFAAPRGTCPLVPPGLRGRFLP